MFNLFDNLTDSEEKAFFFFFLLLFEGSCGSHSGGSDKGGASAYTILPDALTLQVWAFRWSPRPLFRAKYFRGPN